MNNKLELFIQIWRESLFHLFADHLMITIFFSQFLQFTRIRSSFLKKITPIAKSNRTNDETETTCSTCFEKWYLFYVSFTRGNYWIQTKNSLDSWKNWEIGLRILKHFTFFMSCLHFSKKAKNVFGFFVRNCIQNRDTLLFLAFEICRIGYSKELILH